MISWTPHHALHVATAVAMSCVSYLLPLHFTLNCQFPKQKREPRAMDSTTKALNAAVAKGDVPGIDGIIAECAVPRTEYLDSIDSSGFSPLLLAALKGELPAVRALLRHGARIDTCTKGARNHAFHFAARNDHVGVICTMAAAPRGAELLDVPNSNGDTALMMATIGGNVPSARALLACGAKVDVANSSGMTPLLCLAASPTAIAPGATATGTAAGASHGAMALVTSMLAQDQAKSGAPEPTLACPRVCIANADGDTALHFCARTGKAALAAQLLGAGASIVAKNKIGHTALDESAAQLPKGAAQAKATDEPAATVAAATAAAAAAAPGAGWAAADALGTHGILQVAWRELEAASIAAQAELMQEAPETQGAAHEGRTSSSKKQRKKRQQAAGGRKQMARPPASTVASRTPPNPEAEATGAATPGDGFAAAGDSAGTVIAAKFGAEAALQMEVDKAEGAADNDPSEWTMVSSQASRRQRRLGKEGAVQKRGERSAAAETTDEDVTEARPVATQRAAVASGAAPTMAHGSDEPSLTDPLVARAGEVANADADAAAAAAVTVQPSNDTLRWLEDHHPRAVAVDLRPEHVCGAPIRDLSMAQLDVLIEVLQARMQEVEEMRLFRSTCGFPEVA